MPQAYLTDTAGQNVGMQGDAIFVASP